MMSGDPDARGAKHLNPVIQNSKDFVGVAEGTVTPRGRPHFDVGEIGGHAQVGRGRPSPQERELLLIHKIEDLQKELAALRAQMSDYFYSMSVHAGGA